MERQNRMPQLPAMKSSSSPGFTQKDALQNHIIEDLLEKNGLQFNDKHQVDTDGALMLRVLTDTLWNIDEHHEKINHRHFLKSCAVMNSLKLVKCLCKKMPIRLISSALEKKTLVLLYNGDSGDDLDALRYKRFQEKVVKSSKYVDAKDLLPTSASAKFHCLRVYYQVQEWRREAGHLDPEEWGWEITNRLLMPVKTDMPPTPKDLLRIFKTGCESRRCTCKKQCTPACGECKGLSCSNSPKPFSE